MELLKKLLLSALLIAALNTAKISLADIPNGVMIIENARPDIPVILKKVTWDNCSDDTPNITLTNNVWREDWGTVVFSPSNCGLRDIEIEINGRGYKSGFHGHEIPYKGMARCVIHPELVNTDRGHVFMCHEYPQGTTYQQYPQPGYTYLPNPSTLADYIIY